MLLANTQLRTRLTGTRFYPSALTLALLTTALAAPALTTPTFASVDQSQTQTGGALNYLFFSPVGQSFIPTQNSLDYVNFSFDPFGSVTFQVDVFQGEGFGGTLLGTSQALTTETTGINTFVFDAPVNLIPNSAYTFRLDYLSGEQGAILYTDDNYTRGAAYISGNAYSDLDFYFVEGTRSAPVPEASTTVSLGLLLALGGLAVAVKRRKTSAA